MSIADVSIRRPVFATMLIVSLVVLGLVSFTRLGVDLFPRIEFPYVSVTTAMPGASPDTVETEITDLIEEELNSISGLRQMRSTSSEGVSVVILEFELEEDSDVKAQDVRDRISTIVSQLPEDAEPSLIEKVDPDAAPIISVMISGDMPVRELTTYADQVVKERLQRVGGVGSVSIIGGREREMRIWLEPSAMRSRGVTTEDIRRALQNENVELPGGRIEVDRRNRQFGVRTLAEAKTANEFARLPVAYRPNGQTVHIGDIARVEDSVEDELSYAQLNGKPGVALDIRRQSGENTVEVANSIEAAVEVLKREAPPNIEMVVARDNSRFIESSIRDVLIDLAIAIFLVITVTYLFLLSWRSTFIVMLAIPTSLIATFTSFAAMGFTINFITLLALTVAIGLLVDDAIVVVEAAQQDIDRDIEPQQAVSQATKRVALAVLAGTFATLAVFVPIAFMQGVVGRMFFQYGLAIIFSVSVSLFVAFTLTPALSARLLRQEKSLSGWQGRVDQFHALMRNRYKQLVGWSVRRRYLVLLGAIASVLIGMGFASLVPATFMATTDRSEFLATLELPQGSGIAATKEAALKADQALREHPEIDFVFASIGSGTDQNVNVLDFYVGLTPKRRRSEHQMDIMVDAREVLEAAVPEASEIVANEVPWVSGGGVGSTQIDLVISGQELNQINDYALSVAGAMRSSPVLVDVQTSYEGGRPEVQVRLNRDQASDLGISARSLAATIQAMIGGSDAGTFEDEGRRYDVRLRVEEERRQSLADIETMPVRAGSGKIVDLASIAEIDVANGPAQIDRLDRGRQVSVQANMPPGVALSTAVNEVNDILAENPPPQDLATKMEGMARRLADTTDAIIFAFILAILALYIVLASQFDSFGQPVIIMLTAPLSFSGAFAAIWIAGQEMSMFTQIGLIALMGIVMKNGILLVDLANQYRAAGADTAKAMMQAAPERLRPVLMTALAAVFGMVPVALAQSDGSEWRNSMGWVIIGGLTTSTFLTLLVVPAAYTAADDLRGFLVRRSNRAKHPTKMK